MTAFYLASGGDTRTKRRRIARISRALVAAGHTCAYRWWDEPLYDTPRADITPAQWGRIAIAERDAILKAEFVIVLLPGGAGTHAEFGISYGLGKRVFLGYLDDAPPCPFYFLPRVDRLRSRGEAAITAELIELLW